MVKKLPPESYQLSVISYQLSVKEVRTLLITEMLDVGAGLLKLLLVIEHICKPAPTWSLLSTG